MVGSLYLQGYFSGTRFFELMGREPNRFVEHILSSASLLFRRCHSTWGKRIRYNATAIVVNDLWICSGNGLHLVLLSTCTCLWLTESWPQRCDYDRPVPT